MAETAETFAHALVAPSGQPLAALFTGPGRTALAEAWAAEMYARREEIQARVAAQAAARVAEKKAAEARRRRRQPGGEADGAGAAWMERLP